MATKKSSNSKTKTTTKKVDEIKNSNVDIKEEETAINETGKDSIDLDKLQKLIESLQSQVSDLKTENENLKKDAENRLIVSTEVETVDEEAYEDYLSEIRVGRTLDMDDPNRKITVYHTQEMSHNLSTHIKLSTTKRNLRRAGEVVRFSLNDFEELVGEYRRFFEKGILAVSIKDADFADLYNLPIWNEKNNSVYTSKILKEVSSYDFEQLRSFYNDLSEDNKHSFVAFWLGKVYSKESGFYNVEKIGWLKNIANTNIFDPIILEMNTNMTRGNENVVLNADKIM